MASPGQAGRNPDRRGFVPFPGFLEAAAAEGGFAISMNAEVPEMAWPIGSLRLTIRLYENIIFGALC
jgi:hypothetical protein